MILSANFGLWPQDVRNDQNSLHNNVGLWPHCADDDDTCLNVNVGLWPQDVFTSLAQESPEEPRRAQDCPGKPWRVGRALESSGEPRARTPCSMVQMSIFI